MLSHSEPDALVLPGRWRCQFTITKTGEKRTIDGIEFVFQMAPGTEAPSEMLFYVTPYKALCAAEDATHTLHNLYTIRGAQVRDANKWWQALNTTLELFGAKTEVVFASHHWPTWGNTNVIRFLKKQRDLYKYIHDQALQLLNAGYTMTEIGEVVQLPPSLANEWYNRGYYGTVNHDSKAVYQRYMGWYSGNPADLYPLPPVQTAKKYVERRAASPILGLLGVAEPDREGGLCLKWVRRHAGPIFGHTEERNSPPHLSRCGVTSTRPRAGWPRRNRSAGGADAATAGATSSTQPAAGGFDPQGSG